MSARRLTFMLVFAAYLAASVSAHAVEAGRIVFAAGSALVSGKPTSIGQVVQEGDDIVTAAGGYVYLKTVDNGFLILRPNSSARIVSYHIDAANPAETRIKLELLSGVARHISGDAVKAAKQNFRFNTPVAAIGVRGTDFTVFTDQSTSRVAVISGGVVVSGFSSSCGRDGVGPCEGNASRELFAAQSGQVLQVRKGQNVPQLLPLNGLSPDLVAPPRSDEPSGKSTATGVGTGVGAVAVTISGGSNSVSLDAEKGGTLPHLAVPVATPPVSPVPPAPVIPITAVAEPSRQIVWGRWQVVLDQAATIDIVKEQAAKGQIVAINSNFAVVRSAGKDWELPTSGTIGFALKQGEAFILDETSRISSPAQVANGKLQVDFGKATFSTSFDLLSNKNERIAFQALGSVARDGSLDGNNQFLSPTNMAVNGLVNPNNGGSAAYIFQGRVDNSRIASGVTSWGK